MRRASLIAPMLLLAAITLPGTARADSFRCGVNLVNTGDSEESVHDKCGSPSQAVRRKSRFRRMTSDEWTYNQGSGQFIRILLFDANADRLVAITLGDYGT